MNTYKNYYYEKLNVDNYKIGKYAWRRSKIIKRKIILTNPSLSFEWYNATPGVTDYHLKIICQGADFTTMTEVEVMQFLDQFQGSLAPFASKLPYFTASIISPNSGNCVLYDTDNNRYTIYINSLESRTNNTLIYSFGSRGKSAGTDTCYFYGEKVAGKQVLEADGFVISNENTSYPTTGEAVMFTKGKMRRIFIPDKLIQECKDYFNKYDSKYLFCNKNGDNITTNNVYKQIMYYAKQYGMHKNVMHPHSFRHMFAIQFLKSNNNLSLLKDIMGHESINTTAIYLRLSLEEQREEFNKSVSWA